MGCLDEGSLLSRIPSACRATTAFTDDSRSFNCSVPKEATVKEMREGSSTNGLLCWCHMQRVRQLAEGTILIRCTASTKSHFGYTRRTACGPRTPRTSAATSDHLAHARPNYVTHISEHKVAARICRESDGVKIGVSRRRSERRLCAVDGEAEEQRRRARQTAPSNEVTGKRRRR